MFHAHKSTKKQQAPLVSKPAGLCSANGRRTSTSTMQKRSNGLYMSSVDEPWFDEAKAQVLLDLDDLE